MTVLGAAACMTPGLRRGTERRRLESEARAMLREYVSLLLLAVSVVLGGVMMIMMSPMSHPGGATLHLFAGCMPRRLA